MFMTIKDKIKETMSKVFWKIVNFFEILLIGGTVIHYSLAVYLYFIANEPHFHWKPFYVTFLQDVFKIYW